MVRLQLIFALCALALASQGQNITAGIDHQTATPGTQVVIPVVVSGFVNVGALTLIISYDDQVLEYVTYQNTANTVLAGNAYDVNGIPVVAVNGSWVNGIDFPDGTLIEFVFDYAGGNSNLDFFIEHCDVIDPDFEELIIDYSNGSISPGQLIWKGSLSNNWHTPGNWNQNIRPESGSQVLIDASQVISHFPEISGSATAGSVHIAGNINLTINSSGSLTSGSIINQSSHSSGGIFIRSDASGTGSLLHYNSGVQASVERYIGGQPYAWHLVSSPVGSQNIAQLFEGNPFFAFYEPANTWVNFQNSALWPTWQVANQGSGNLIPGKGYLTACEIPTTKTFYGALTQGSIEFTLSKQAPVPDNPGYNLLGNPYPSSIDWKAENGWSGRENLQNDAGGYTLWIWNHDAGNYGTYNSASSINTGTLGVSRYIAPMQGFFVKAANNAGIIGLDDQVRVHSGQTWLSKNEIPHVILNLEVSGSANSYRDMVIVEISGNETGGGAEKMFSMLEEAPSLFIKSNQHAYSMYYLDNIETTKEISLHLIPGAPAVHSITADRTELFDVLVLEDLHTQTSHNFKQNNTYHFSAAPGDPGERFLLHLKEASHVEEFMPNHSRLFFSQGWIFLDNMDENTTVLIYDVAGRQLKEFQAIGRGMHKWGFDELHGIYLYRLTSRHTSANGKLIIY
jgi:hypothetical protein